MFNIEFLQHIKTVVCSLEGKITSDKQSGAVFLLVNDEMSQAGIQLDLHKNLEQAFNWLRSLN